MLVASLVNQTRRQKSARANVNKTKTLDMRHRDIQQAYRLFFFTFFVLRQPSLMLQQTYLFRRRNFQATFTRVRTNIGTDEFCTWTACLHGTVQILLQIAMVFTWVRANFETSGGILMAF